jgi:hypothetical protein
MPSTRGQLFRTAKVHIFEARPAHTALVSSALRPFFEPRSPRRYSFGRPSQGSSLSILTEPHDERAARHSITSSASASSDARSSVCSAARWQQRRGPPSCARSRPGRYARSAFSTQVQPAFRALLCSPMLCRSLDGTKGKKWSSSVATRRNRVERLPESRSGIGPA